jgi:hypothetical protein
MMLVLDWVIVNRGVAGLFVKVTVTEAEAELFGFRSAVEEETEAMLVKTPCWVARARIVMVTLPPLGRLGKLQLTSPSTAVHVPWEDWALRILKAAGTGSSTVTLVAVEGPRLVRTIVKVTLPEVNTLDGEAV